MNIRVLGKNQSAELYITNPANCNYLGQSLFTEFKKVLSNEVIKKCNTYRIGNPVAQNKYPNPTEPLPDEECMTRDPWSTLS